MNKHRLSVLFAILFASMGCSGVMNIFTQAKGESPKSEADTPNGAGDEEIGIDESTIPGTDNAEADIDLPQFPGDMKINTYVVGESGDFLVGDATSAGPVADSFGETCAVGQPVSQSGRSLVVPLTLLHDNTRIGVTISDICGVSAGGGRVYLLYNGKPLGSPKEISKVLTSLVLQGFNVSTGALELVIDSLESNGIADDFLVGKITIKASKEISVGNVAIKE